MGLIEIIKDAWGSNSTGSNTSMDRRTSYGLLSSMMSPTEATNFYQCSDVAQRIVDGPVGEAFREGWEIQVPDQHDLAQTISAQLQDLKYLDALKEALRKSRVCGGSAIYMHTNDADLSQPLKPGSKILRLHVFAGGSELLSTQDLISSLDSKDFGLPAYFKVQQLGGLPVTGLDRIHRSRLVIFSQPIISRMERLRNFGFGPSVLGSLSEPIRNFEIAFSDSAGLITDWGQPVIKLRGLNAAMGSAGDSGDSTALKLRLQGLNWSRSLYKSIFLDAGDQGTPAEEFSRVTTPMAGLPDLLDRQAQRLSMASRIPVPILMGESPAGLNATGDSSIRAYYDHCATLQTDFLLPAITQLIQALLGPKEPKSWSVVFHPLWTPTDLEQATTRKTQADTDQIYFAMGVLAAEEIRTSRFGSDEYSSHTSIDPALKLPEPIEGT